MRKYFLLLSILFVYECSTPEKNDSDFLQINLHTSSTIKLEYKNLTDTIIFIAGHGNFFPNDFIELKPVKLCGDGTEYVSVSIQLPQKVEISLNEALPLTQNGESDPNIAYSIEETCFLVPGDTIEIKVDYSKIDSLKYALTFAGNYAQITEYYQQKKNFFNGRNLIYEKAMLANMTTDLESFKQNIDSLTITELRFLYSYLDEYDLPAWFVNYEVSDLKYFAFGIKLSEPMLLEFTHGKKPDIPDKYFSFTDELLISNMDAILSIYYFLGLRDYFYNVYEPQNTTNHLDSASVEKRLNDFVDYSHSNFSPYISDIILSRELELLISHNWFSKAEYDIIHKNISDSSLKSYFEARYEHKDVLKLGDHASNFYLMDEMGNYFTLNDLKGNLVYISFWFTACKPCIKEFPDENKLVDAFKDQKVKIVSICMNSDEDSWKKLISKHELKTINLIAKGNWNSILKEKYDISGFPHYVLIDKEGCIIQNKCERPSSGAEQLIETYLNK